MSTSHSQSIFSFPRAKAAVALNSLVLYTTNSLSRKFKAFKFHYSCACDTGIAQSSALDQENVITIGMQVPILDW